MTPGVESTTFRGLRALRLVAGDGSSAVVCEQGAQVVSWQSAEGREQLYLSPRSQFEPGVAIRGGIPVVFPQFGGAGPLPRHGCARTALWQAGDRGSDGTHTWAALRLRSDETTRQLWPHDFEATLALRLGLGNLDVALQVRNTGHQPLSFQAALHTYLGVEAVEEVAVQGLQGRRYREAGNGPCAHTQTEPALRIAEALDRVYLDVPSTLHVQEPGRTRALTSHGFPDAVVWNPGRQACAAMVDMPADGWQHLLCIEAAAVAEPQVLAPGQVWTGSQGMACGAA